MRLEEPWNAAHDATPQGWFVRRPGYDERHTQWTQAAFDSNDRGKAGKPRTREWLAVATSELGVLQEMARCLLVIGEGEWPK